MQRLKVCADGFELFLRVAFEEVGAETGAVIRVGVAGHLGVRDHAGGIEHPLVVLVRAEALVDFAEVNALDFEGGEGGFVILSVAGDTGIARHCN